MALSPTRYGILKHPLAKATLLVSLASVISIAAAQQAPQELAKAIYVATVTLIFGGMLGGVLKLMLDDVTTAKREREDNLAAAQRRREDAATFVRNVLNDLKSVYDRVGRSRILILAHKSAKTYGDEMRDLIPAGVQLRNVARALQGRPDGISATASAVRAHVDSMEDYLQRLASEFSTHYKPISDQQRGYEMRVDSAFASFAATGAEAPVAVRNTVWEALDALPVLHDFLDGGRGSQYQTHFESPLDKASGLLRLELSAILSATGALSPPDALEHAEVWEEEDGRARVAEAPARTGRKRGPSIPSGSVSDIERVRPATDKPSAPVGTDAGGPAAP